MPAIVCASPRFWSGKVRRATLLPSNRLKRSPPSRLSSDLALGFARCSNRWRYLDSERGGRNGGTGVLRPEGSGAELTASNRGPGGGPPEHDSLRPVFH